jgi:hypothetical protein
MALKFDFNKLRTAVRGFLPGSQTDGSALAAGKEAIFIPQLRVAKANIITWSAALSLEHDDCASIVVTGDTSAGILTLPTAAQAGAGWYVDIMINHAQASNATHITVGDGYFIGGLVLLDKDTSDKSEHFNSDNDSNDFINLDAATKGNDPGGNIRIVCDGTNWLVSGVLVGDGTLGTPFADAES